jgi:methylenetetrahydrofolate dehydrogenase (NADP+)/methenyltetrahydrofolate cyclohydrolase
VSAPEPVLLDGKALAERLRTEHAADLHALAQVGRRPRLVVVKVGPNEAAESYLRGQARGAERWGIDYAVETLPGGATERTIRRAIRDLNEDDAVTGILLALPLPAGIGARGLQRGIDPRKDVEGVHPENLGGALHGRRGLLPCTALAVVALIESTGVPLQGKECVVVGHSEIVGKPVALLLLAADATVTVCHKFTSDLALHTRRADVLVVAAGRPGLVRGDMVKRGAIVVDVGINAVPDTSPREPGEPPRTRIVGDVDFDAVRPLTSFVTPVPGGVGPVTVAMLMRNTVLAARGAPPPDDPAQLPLFHR